MAKNRNALQKERIDKLLEALWVIANDLPVSAEGFQNVAKNGLLYDKIKTKKPEYSHVQ